jgi:ketol-acid reductoisomerase
MIGQAVRSLYVEGAGFPCLVAAHQDATGQALPTALALARAIGATRCGAFASSFEEETLIDLFAEQMLWPGIIKLCLLYFEKLVDAGCDPEVVTNELYLSGEFFEIAKAMITDGFFGQLKLHSHTSQYGQLSRADRMAPDALLEAVDDAMAGIQSGAFAREWADEQEKGLPALQTLWQKALDHPLTESENRLESLRALMASRLEPHATS